MVKILNFEDLFLGTENPNNVEGHYRAKNIKKKREKCTRRQVARWWIRISTQALFNTGKDDWCMLRKHEHPSLWSRGSSPVRSNHNYRPKKKNLRILKNKNGYLLVCSQSLDQATTKAWLWMKKKGRQALTEFDLRFRWRVPLDIEIHRRTQRLSKAISPKYLA